MFNLNEYEVDSSSEVSDTNREIKKEEKPLKKKSIGDESLSEGQIVTFTDQDSSSYITGNKTPSVIKNNIDLNILKNFNNNLRQHLILNDNNNKDSISQHRDDKSSISNIHEDIQSSERHISDKTDNDSSTISINVQKHLVNINDNDALKTLGLYDSKEFWKFQNDYGRANLNRFNTQQSQPIGSNRTMNNNSEEGQKSDRSSENITQFKFHKANTAQNIQGGNNPNPTLFSFGNNNKEIENLIKRQSQLNEKLKNISNMNNNNTIPEGNSELKVYATDESSEMNSNNINLDNSSVI